MLTACVAAFTAAFVGCKKQVGAKPLQEGPETGVYYLDDEFGENLLTLSDGGYFTFTYRGKTTSGSYTLKDGALALDFKKDEDGEAVGEYSDGVISVTYGDASLRMLKKEYYSVAFETNGGSAVAAKAVLNGKTLEKPADPEKSGSKFIAWYTDAECKGLPFAFETGAITADTTLYALWAEYDEAVAEYEIKFDLGYDGATLPAASTVGGKLYNVAAPERDGYAFLGWWISAYNDGEKLTAAYAPDYVFNADTTLYALWAGEGETPALMSVDVNGAKWSNVNKAAKITVEGPNGLKAEETVGTTAGNAYNYDFTTKPAGDYKITLESDGKKVERYYLNGALARVSGFRVVGNSVLMFNPVAGAEKYLITVECGDPRHNHAEKDNGTSTNYNFVNCPMKVGGITFTVKAVAAGKATSVATYTFDRTLKKAENLAYNAENGLLTWNAVREAAEYVVFVGEDEYNVGNATRFSLKNYSGELAVKVVCKTDGYNSSVAELAVNKTAPVSPADIKINGDTLVWAAAENAVGYVVRIGEKEYETVEATFALGEKIKELNSTDPKGQDYSVSVKTKFENCESLWSDALDVRYYALDKSLTYDRGVLSWNYVVGATEYEVTVNGKAYKTAESEYAVTLTQSGENTLTVRFITADGADDEIATYTVNAYKLTFDSQQGEKVDAVYRATGDPMNLPTELLRDGYDFVGWYNSASASGVYGKRYDEEYFDGNSDIVLYAGWSPKTYTAQLDYNEAGEGAEGAAQVTYTKNYTITPPAIKAEHNDKVFAGWFSSPDGKGVQYTDELGNSLRAWQHTADMKLYAVYKDAYKYTLIGADYEVTANPLLAGSKLTELTIPAEHDGKKVVSVGTYAFQGFKRLEKINIPDTVTFIDATAFYGCISLKTYAVYTPEGKTPVAEPAYTAVDGSLLYNNKITGETELVATPSVLTGAYAIPYGVTRLGTRTFYKSGLTEIIVPASVTNVAQEAFLDCKSLTKLSFAMPQGEQKLVSLTIAANSISGCNALETLELPARLNEIPNAPKAFNAFKNLKEINVIGECDAQVYSSLTEKDGQGANGILTNADKSEIIFCPLKKEFKAVADGNGVSYEFVVPNAVTAIGANAFNMFRQTKETDNVYYALNAITFHSGIVSIGEKAFYDLAYLRKVTFGAGNAPLGLTIGESAFEGCRLINTVTFDESDGKVSCVKEIGKRAFYGSSVTSLALPSSLETIGESAFAYCDDLTELDLSRVNGNLTFGAYAFAYCNALPSVEITDNVGEMEFSSVFYKCRTLREVIVPATNPNFESVDGVLYSKGRETILYYPSGLTGNYTLDPATKRIGGGVFSGRDNITEITIPASVTEIGENSFENCANLTTVDFLAPAAGEQSSSLTIGNGAFINCPKLTAIELPARTVSIGDNCFIRPSSRKNGFLDAPLKTVVLHEGLQTIGENAFRSTALESVVIPSTVTEIGKSAFKDSKIKTITFTENSNDVVALTLGSGVFDTCNELESVVLREGTRSVPEKAFYFASKLKSVTIPKTVANDNNTGTYAIGVEAFDGCAALTSIVFAKGGELPLSIARNAFLGCTSLTEINLPKRASSFSNKYDVFEISTGKLDNKYMFTSFGDSPDSALAPGKANTYTIENYNVEEGGEFWSYKGVLYSGDKKTVIACPFGKKGEVEIAKEATTFRPCAFFGCKFITKITFEKGGDEPFVIADCNYSSNYNPAKSTYEGAFYACPMLETIEFPSRLKSIGNYAFMMSTSTGAGTNLTTISFGENSNLESIGRQAFENTTLTELTLPDGVIEVGESIFKGCKKFTSLNLSASITGEMLVNLIKDARYLTEINISANSTDLSVDECGVVYNADRTLIVCMLPSYKSTVTEYTVPYTVSEIGEAAFRSPKADNSTVKDTDVTALRTLTFEATPAGQEEKPLKINSKAFEGSGITALTLPKRLTGVGTNVFRNCRLLATLDFENGYKCESIGQGEFEYCVKLTEVTLPGEITSIGTQAFGNNTLLKTVTFGLDSKGNLNQLARISSYAFQDCKALTTLRIETKAKDVDGNSVYEEKLPDSVTVFGESNMGNIYGPFNGCTSLERMVIPSGVTKLGNSAFLGCTSLVSVVLPQGLNAIGAKAFSGCTKLETVTFDPDTQDASVTLANNAFLKCAALTDFNFAKISAFIGSDIFSGCKALKNVDIHNQLDAGAMAKLFKDCTGITTVTFDPLSGSVGDSAFSGCTNLTTVTIGENVTEIGTRAFDGCAKLATVNMNSTSLTTIDNYAFQNCTLIKSFDFPATLQTIGSGAFASKAKKTALSVVDLSRTTDLTIKGTAFKNGGVTTLNLGGTKSIEANAFEGCTKLTSVVVPDNFLGTDASKLDKDIFKGCTTLQTVDYQSKLDVPEEMFIGCTALTRVTINDNVKQIGTQAFSGCTKLASITLPAELTKIGKKAFYGCTKLASVAIGNKLQSIGENSFQNCKSLTAIDLPDTFTDIGANAFNGCTLLANVGINSDIDIGAAAFTGCSNDLALNIKDGVNMDFVDRAIYKDNTLIYYIGKAESLTVKEDTAVIGDNAFSGNTAIVSVTLPSSVKEIGMSAFKGCTALTTINLDYVTKFGSMAFQNDRQLSFTNLVLNASELPNYLFDACASITNVTFGADNVKIGEYTFRGCSGITRMVNTIKVAMLGKYAFQNAFAETASLDLDFSAAKTAYKAGRIFDGAKGLKSIKISGIMVDSHGNDNYCIYDYMFNNCVNLVSVTSVNKVEKIGTYVFSGCTKLTLDDMDMSKVTSIENKAFLNCVAITNLDLPNIEYLGQSTLYPTQEMGVFKGCTSLRMVVLGDKITAISNGVFMGCTSLESVEMPNVNTLCANSFGGCTSMTSLTLTSAVQTVYAGAFNGWTDAQTIRLVDYEEGNLPDGWNANWAKGCNANIIYKRAEAAA